ncbi:MAG: class I SAM-dependent methyltransferase [Gammaproteobacteria bacterium]
MKELFTTKNVGSTFDQKAQNWNNKKLFHTSIVGVTNRLIKILPDILKPGMQVLDIGSGSGKIVRNIKKICSKTEVFASEISFNMLSDNSAENLFLCDIQNMCFKDNMFDLVTSQQVIHHLPKPSIGLKEIHRVLKPNGLFLMLTVGNQYQSNIFPYKQCHITKDPLGRITSQQLQKLHLECNLKPIMLFEDFFDMHFNNSNDYFMFMSAIGAIDKIFKYKLYHLIDQEKRQKLSDKIACKTNNLRCINGHYITLLTQKIT